MTNQKCPFCGNSHINKEISESDGKAWVACYCTNCFASGPLVEIIPEMTGEDSMDFDNRATTTGFEAWNRRA